jgi:hypothetical protein
MLEEVQNSNWGTCKLYSTERLIALASSSRPSDFFNFVPPKPPDSRHPLVRGERIVWIASPEEPRGSRMADLITLDLWSKIQGDEAGQLALPNSGVLLWVEVEWGSGGTMVQARVDVGRGTQLVLPADAIVCRLGCDALPNLGDKEDVPWNPLPVEINAMVGRYGGAPRWKAQRTLFVSALAHTQTQVLRVPDFAYAVRIDGIRAELDALTLIEFRSNTGSTYQVLGSWSSLTMKDAVGHVPLPNGTQAVAIVNGSVSTDVSLLSVEFALAI